MTQTALEQFRIRILLLVEATRSIGSTEDELSLLLHTAGLKHEHDELEREVGYLVERTLLRKEIIPRLIGLKQTRIHITADGRDWLAENNFRPTP